MKYRIVELVLEKKIRRCYSKALRGSTRRRIRELKEQDLVFILLTVLLE